jgi:hypothetical protein
VLHHEQRECIVLRRVITLLSLVAVPMAVAVAVSAEEPEAEAVGSARGNGWVWAKGAGIAILDGRGIVHMAIDGDVVVYDYAGDAVVKAGAIPEEEPDGAGAQMQGVSPTSTYTFDNFRGRLHIAGSDFRIEAEGEMKFRGHGKGVVEVDGRGWWKTLHRRGTWNGATLHLGSESAG